MTTDVKAAEKAVVAEEKGKDELASILGEIKTGMEKVSGLAPALEEKMAEVRAQGENASAESKAAVEALAKDLTEQASVVAELKTHGEELAKKMDRPSFGTKAADDADRVAAINWKKLVHNAKHKSAEVAFDESSVDMDEYFLAKKGMEKMIRTQFAGDRSSYMSPDEMKSLNSFAFEGNNFVLQPEFSDQIINCEDDKQDVTQFFDSVTISKGSIVYPINNDLDFRAAWACENECFANNPKTDLSDGWGQLEMKPHKLRYALCADRDFLDDAEIDMVAWMRDQVGTAFRDTECDGFISGDGIQKPTGILHPNAGIPKVETSAATNPGEISWQDVNILPYMIDRQNFTNESAYFMNQSTWAKIMTMSDANGKPIWMMNPSQRFPITIGGFPVIIMDAMPDIAVGSCPIAFGNWRQVYRIVRRKALEMQRDDYSGGYCPIFKFESRVTGGVICPNKARLLLVK